MNDIEKVMLLTGCTEEAAIKVVKLVTFANLLGTNITVEEFVRAFLLDEPNFDWLDEEEE